MIVVCTRCQARFRVADEKVGSRGARVRCSRCENVFVITKGPDPFTAVQKNVSVSPEGEPGASPDPNPTPLSEAAERAAQAEPPAQATKGSPLAPGAPSSKPEETDSFEFGQDTTPLPAASRALARAEHLAFDRGPFDVPPIRPPPVANGPKFWSNAAAEPEGDEIGSPEKIPGRRTRAVRPDLSAPSNEALVGTGEEIPTEEPSFDFSGQPDPASVGPLEDPGPERGPGAGVSSDAASPLLTALFPPSGQSLPFRERTIGKRLSRRARVSMLKKSGIIVGALVAMALFATAALLPFRSEGRPESNALRQWALLRGLAGQAFAVTNVKSGEYERANGPPLLYVSGRIVSKAPNPVRAIKVSVEVVRLGEVLARGHALAGALPTPEEVYGVRDASALATVLRNAEARIPSSVKPGESVPFFVAIADYPRDLEGAALQIKVGEGVSGKSP